jgi:hypothetical protein
MTKPLPSARPSSPPGPSPKGGPGPVLLARKESRRAVDVSASLTIGGRVVVVRTRDISRSGVCLISDSELPRDVELAVALVLSLGKEASSEPLHLSGRTAWSTRMFGRYQSGVMFVELDADRRRYLDLFMRFFEGEVGPAASDGDSDRISASGIVEDKDDPFRP